MEKMFYVGSAPRPYNENLRPGGSRGPNTSTTPLQVVKGDGNGTQWLVV
jgi:hypothetical protein